VVLDNHGFSSIGGLTRACGNRGMGTEYRYRRNGKLEGDLMPVDYVVNARSLGAEAVRATTRDEFKRALLAASRSLTTSVVVIETAYDQRVPAYESWWDVPIAEVSEIESVRAARLKYEEAVRKERLF
jgi:3D-(3,5/4)-trihydroxycyclohexane-1,2-dione acylhydrolase (decyclizing)